MLKSIRGQSNRADFIFQRMKAVMVFEKDIKEDFVTSPGPGGQNVNKVATCVVLKHMPSGLVIKCHECRTQLANRVLARELLVKRFEFQIRKKKQELLQQKSKERARKRKRSARSKERMLENKRQRSQKKQSRHKISYRKIQNDI